MIADEMLTETVDGVTRFAPFPERPRWVSDDEWRAAQARTGIVIPDTSQTVAVAVLRNGPWRAPDCRVFIGDGPDVETQADRAALDHYRATGFTSHVEVVESWPAAGVAATVTVSGGGSPGFFEMEAEDARAR